MATGAGWVLDLDGVVWLDDRAIDGSADAVADLRARGERVLFVTNNSSVPVGEVEAKLAGFGIPAEGDVVTSAMAGASLVEPGERALVVAGPGVVEALEARGAEPVRDGDADVVVVGFHRDFDWERMRVAATAIRRGARFVATNDDATYPTPDGPVPGGGAIVASVAVAAGIEPEIAGKPHRPMADLVAARLGGLPACVVGDRPSTDGAFARALGVPFVLVLTGVETAPESLDPAPAHVVADLRSAVTGITFDQR